MCYEQLEDNLMGYKRVPLRYYFKHLGGTWCKMDTKAVMKTTAKFYDPWNQVMYFTKFANNLTSIKPT